MEIKYRVHSVEQQLVTALVTLNGEQVQAQVPGLVVEIVSDDGLMGHTLRLVPHDMEAALALFVLDTEIVSTFTPAA